MASGFDLELLGLDLGFGWVYLGFAGLAGIFLVWEGVFGFWSQTSKNAEQSNKITVLES